jgi:hypothetical protein
MGRRVEPKAKGPGALRAGLTPPSLQRPKVRSGSLRARAVLGLPAARSGLRDPLRYGIPPSASRYEGEGGELGPGA